MTRRVLTLLVAAMLTLGLQSQPASADNPTDPGDDTVAPVITITAPSGSWQGWYRDTVDVRINVTDSHTGATGVQEATYTLSGATTSGPHRINVRDGATVTVSAVGSTLITVDAVDRADNAARSSYAVGVDRQAPTVTFNPEVTPGAVFARGQTVPLRYTCADDFTGVAECAGNQPSGGDLDTRTIGTSTVQVNVRDNAGNAALRGIAYQVVEPYFAVAEPVAFEGTAVVGGALLVKAPRFVPLPDRVDYQWRRNGQPIPGATSERYSPTAADAGQQLTVTATAVKTAFQSATTTSGARTVANGTFTIAQAPSVTGTPRVGETLTLSHGVVTPPPATAAYRWQRDGQTIAGATSRTYELTAADLGTQVTGAVVASGPGFDAATFASAPVTVGAGVLRASGGVWVDGTARVGSVLSVRPLSFTPAATVSYRWLRNGAPISGATARTYRLTAADRGRRVSVRVTATRAGYATVTSEAAETATVAKVTPTVRASAKARGKKRVRVTVTVRTTGVVPTGKVTIKRGSKVVARSKTLRGGKVVVDLKRQKKGRASYTAVYAGSTGFNARSDKAKRIRVR